jgi:polyvinyl alcohol dehydrogenase (cytochrome)
MKPVDLAGVDLWAVLLASVAIVVLRFIWYSPWLFGRSGADSNENASPKSLSTARRTAEYLLVFVASLITAFTVGKIIRLATVETMFHGIRLAFGVWLAFVLTIQISDGLLKRKPAKLCVIDGAYQLVGLVVAAAIIAPWPQRSKLGMEAGFGLFKENCATCHGNPNVQPPAPDPATLRQLTPEAIYASLTTGTMKFQGQRLTNEAKRRIAEALGGRPLGAASLGDAKDMPNVCADNPPLSDPAREPAWNGWGVDSANTRFQPEPSGLDPSTVPRLKLKWAFGFPNGVSAFAQPTVASGRVFVGSDIGYVYSLDAASGCIHWSFKAKAAVRNAISIGGIETDGGSRYAIYFGDIKANVYALDASSGALLWTTHIEEHFLARITGAPKLYEHTLYVPVASSEEWSAGSPSYPCCTFRGSVVALDSRTGHEFWKTYTISEEPKATVKNSESTQLWAPAGAGVWNSATVDSRRHAIYFGTGNSYTEPASAHSDSIMALDMSTGKVLWTFQATTDDASVTGCFGTGRKRSDNCPARDGPDYDFGASPILRTLPDGRRFLIAAQKSGVVFGLDPDRNGALVWKTNLADRPPPTTGSILFGGAADEDNVYFGLTSGGMAAVKISTGEKLWFSPMVAKKEKPDQVGMSAAVSAIPGVAFVGGWDGTLHALSTSDGKVLWEYRTAREFDTVNKVKSKGGSMGGPGPVIANGMLFVGSGYFVFGGSKPGNVLLAFSPD